VPTDEGEYRREHGPAVVVRGQTYFRSLVVGVSHLRSDRSEPGEWATGRMVFSGIDARWAHEGLVVRGEWLDGEPFDDVITRGGYIDVMFEREWTGPVTAVARIEKLDYFAGEHSAFYQRQTVGGRIRIARMIAVQLNLIRQPDGLSDGRRIAFDAGLTFSARF
jgi:hypothetical protein